jgi:transposase
LRLGGSPATARITLAELRLLLRCVLLPSETVRFVSEWRQNGATSAKSRGGDQRSHRIEAHREMILSVIKAKPDMTLVQIAEMLEAETGASFAPSSVWRFLDRHAITFKKNAHATEQDRPDVAAARGLA